jgi:hypothetical protein
VLQGIYRFLLYSTCFFFCPFLKKTKSNSTTASSSTSPLNEMLTMEDHIQSLISMGFVDRELNRRALVKANNDIGEAVTILTGSNYFNDDILIPTEITTTTPTFIGPLTKEQLEQQQQQEQTVSR